MESHHHYILHKPYGYISQFVSYAPKNHKQKFLGELYAFEEGTMSIGRLDEKSEGLLLLTTDGNVSNEINSNKFEKEYFAQVDGLITDEAVLALNASVQISINGKPYTTVPGEATKIEDPGFPERSKKVRDDRHGPTSWVSLTIREGKYHQVRKMCAAVGFPVLRLVRVRIGNIELGTLESGEVREAKNLVAR